MVGESLQYLVDEQGNRTAVVLDLKRYRELLAAHEEIECVREFDEAKASGEVAIPFEQAIREIEESRK